MCFNIQANGSMRLTRGDTARFTVDINNDATDELYEIGENDELTFSIKRNLLDTEPVLLKTLTGSNQFHIKPEDTADLDFGQYKYDVELHTADGDVYTVIEPNVFEIAPEVTCR